MRLLSCFFETMGIYVNTDLKVGSKTTVLLINACCKLTLAPRPRYFQNRADIRTIA